MQTSFVFRLVIVIALVLPQCLADTEFDSRVAQVRAKLQYYINDLSSSDKDRIKQDINNLQSIVGSLNELQSRVDSANDKVRSTQEDYNNAEQIAERRREEYEITEQNAKSKGEAVYQAAVSACAQSGGSMNDTTCVCPPKKFCSFDSNSFNAQLKSIEDEVNTKQQQAAAAQRTASARKSEFADASSQQEQIKNDLKTKKERFDAEAKRIEDEIDNANKHPLNDHLGPAAHQMPSAMKDPGCFDTGCVPVPDLPDISVPAVLSKYPDSAKAYDHVVEARDKAVQRAQDARQAFKDYVISGGQDTQELNRRYRADSQAQFDAYKAQIAVRTYTDLLNPIAPKPAEQNNVK